MNTELLDAFSAWGEQQGKSENTLKTYHSVIKRFDDWLIEQGTSLKHVKQCDVQAYMDYLDQDQNRSASTIDKIFASIRVFSQFLDKPSIAQNIDKKVKEQNIYQTKPDFLNEAEKIELLNKVKKDGNLRNIAIVFTLLDTGVRVSELCALNHSDIDIRGQKGVLTVRDSHSDHNRVIPLSKDVVVHLGRYFDSKEQKDGIIFRSKDGNSLTTRSVQNVLKAYHVSPNVLRHTFCQNLIDKGMDLSVVAQLAGHKDINITKRYKRDDDRDSNNQSLA